MVDSNLAKDLKALLGRERVSTRKGDLDRFSGDALGTYRAFGTADRLFVQPQVVVHPSSTDQVSQVVRLANARRVPIVPYGGGTGVMGGAVAADGCIVLDLRGMDRILQIGKEDRTARVQAGVLLGDLEEALNKEGLLLGHDPWSRPIATVGGAISTDGVGYRAARYGSMGEQVLGLEVVLASGQVISTKGVPKASSGPSLKSLFIGAEGTLGIITEATLRVFPQPEKRIVRAIGFPDFESGFRAVMGLYAQDVHPAMVDFGEEPAGQGSQESGDVTLYLGFEGFQEDVEAQEHRSMAICQRHGGFDQGEDEARCFWETRHQWGERYQKDVLESPRPGQARRRRSSYPMDYLHVALPASRVLEYRRRCEEILSSYRVVVREWSLWAKPEFFSLLIVEGESAGDQGGSSMAEAVDRLLTLAQDMGGAMEYCHGVGIKLAHLMEREQGAGMEVVRQIKKALDPNNILNPGKLGV